ncbi:unnamed protein product [Ascophyllum nodosum]
MTTTAELEDQRCRGEQLRSPCFLFAAGNSLFWPSVAPHSGQDAATKKSQSGLSSGNNRRPFDPRRLNIEVKQIAPRRADHGQSYSRSNSHSSKSSHSSNSSHEQGRSRSQNRSLSTDAQKMRPRPLVTTVGEHDQQRVDSMSDLSSMRVQGSSNDERGYDGVSEAAGSVRVSRDGYVDTTGLRPGGKEPAVQGCGCMTAATFVKMVTALVALYYGGILWAMYYDHSTGRLCAFYNKTICAETVVSQALLTISKMSAGALFPSITCCVLSKCYATRYFLHHSWLSLVVNVEPAHDLHTYFGTATLLFGCVHGAAHVARTLHDGHAGSMIKLNVNRSGLVSLVLLLPIAAPMLVGFLKSRLTFEVRKMLHMLFIPLIIALCFHTPALRLAGAILLTWYILDRLYFTIWMTFFIQRPVYKPVGRGTFVRFDLPAGYQFKVGAYVQVNCPAISAYDWHPFSLFPVPGSKPRAGFHVEAVGDWTEELFRLSFENPRMPLWITVAQPSVLEKCIYFDNVLMVCTGAGITPAVSLAEMFAKKKNVHLLWLSREASMIAMFEKQLRQVKSTVHLTGKPSTETKARIMQLLSPSRAEVIFTAPGASTRPSSRSSSLSDLTALEAGSVNESSIGEVVGAFSVEDADDNHSVGSVTGGDCLALRGSYSAPKGGGREVANAGADAGANNAQGTRYGRSRARQHKRFRGLHPVSVCFGRPDVGRFIAETVQGTATRPEWANRSQRAPLPADKNINPAPRSRQSLERLTSSQRISKRDLMIADLSVVKSKSSKGSFISDAEASAGGGGAVGASTDPGTWLVLYCGANSMVEKAVASTCGNLKVTWRKEYFSAW